MINSLEYRTCGSELRTTNISKWCLSYTLKAHLVWSASCRVVWVILSQMSCTKVTFNPSSCPNSKAQGLRLDFKSFIPSESFTKQHVWHRAGNPIGTHTFPLSLPPPLGWPETLCSPCLRIVYGDFPCAASQAIYRTTRNPFSRAFRVRQIIKEPPWHDKGRWYPAAQQRGP